MSPVEQKLGLGGAGYPERLANVAEPPEVLYLRGAWAEAASAVAIVGSRGATVAGAERARALSAQLADGGAQIVSGGAVGIDAAAHRGALDAGGHTVAVFACALDRLYPAKNETLFADIEDAGGALVSPHPRGAPPRRFHFVRRNRLIAALADAVIAVDCRMGSGAFHTAEAAWKQGKVVGAVPGSPGCEALIAEGVAVVECAGDVLAAVAGEPRGPEVAPPVAESAGAGVLAALGDRDPMDAGEISEATGIPVRSVTRALAELELSGLAVPLPGRAYLRSRVARALSG